MKTFKTILPVFLMLLVLVSCSDDDPVEPVLVYTEGELLGQELLKISQEQGVYYATSYMMYTWSNGEVDLRYDEWEEAFAIDGQVMRIGETYYNLNKLVKYDIEELIRESKEVKVLNLYFEGLQN